MNVHQSLGDEAWFATGLTFDHLFCFAFGRFRPCTSLLASIYLCIYPIETQ